MRFSFKPSILSILGTVALIGLFLALGNWQLERAQEKQAAQKRLDTISREPPLALPPSKINPDQYQFRTVQVEGQFEPRCTIYLDNRIRQHIPGYEIITPLRIGGSDKYVAVNRGWIAGTGDRTVLPQVPAPKEEVKIVGTAIVPSERRVELSAQTQEGRVWQNLVLERYREWCKLDLAPIIIRQTSQTADSLVRTWPRPDLGIDVNRGYALQWFSLAAAVLVLFFVLNVKRDSRGTG
jgi:surfeit locus 1 family protein